ncbi:MAG: serine hydrolase [Rhodocyclales bacterium]|nr:serine hydrolase [Rhodocyclales bacterium]
MFRTLCAMLFAGYVATAAAMPLGSKYALVVEEDSGRVLLEKNAEKVVPIASLTKLITAMVVLDANPDLDELICIEEPEVTTKKRSWSRLRVGAWMPRKDVLQLALMSSDNRAAASLAASYPGGSEAFVAAVQAKLDALGMSDTTIEEATGLSANNRSTAADLVKMAMAAAQYPEIARITTDSSDSVAVNGRNLEYHNTNRLVGRKGWDILLSKTGTTKPAGRCLIMRLQAAGRTVVVVLLNARASSMRVSDAVRVRRLIDGESVVLAQAASERRARRVAANGDDPSRRSTDRLQLAQAEALR